MDGWNGRCLAVLALFSKCFMEKGKRRWFGVPMGYYHGNEDGLEEMTKLGHPFLVIYKLKLFLQKFLIKI
jgi:hypothetical protein